MASVNPQGWPIISRLLTLDPALDSLSLSPSKVQNHPNITDRVIQKIQHSRHGSYGPKKLDWLLVEMWGIYIYTQINIVYIYILYICIYMFSDQISDSMNIAIRGEGFLIDESNHE